MKEIKLSGNYKEVFDFILKNDLLKKPELRILSDFLDGFDGYEESLINDNETRIKKLRERRIKDFSMLMELMDRFSDFYKAFHFKYRLNITESRYGAKYFQLKGTIGYDENGKKIWVSKSLGNEEAVFNKYKTIDSDTLINLNNIEMIELAYKALRQRR
jgi:hypothetical protein